MSSELESQARELAALLQKAYGHDAQGDSALPADPHDLDVSNVASWNDVAGILAAYPQGLPADLKNSLVEVCKKLTQAGHANPDLSVRVIRMPVLGGRTTRVAKQSISTGGRRRTGLTRTGGSLSLTPKHVAELHRGPTMDAPEAPVAASPERLKQLESAATKMQTLLGHLAADHPNYAGLKAQCVHAWEALHRGLEARLNYLRVSDASVEAQQAYARVMAHVETVIKDLSMR